MTAPAATTPRLTAENIFYNGFAAVAPLGTTQGGSYLDSELQTFAPDVPSNVGYYGTHDTNTKTLRLQRQYVALNMVLGRRVDQMNQNIQAAEKKHSELLQSINANLTQLVDAMKGVGKTMEKQRLAGPSTSNGIFGMPVFSQSQAIDEDKSKSTMMSRLIENIAAMQETSQESATPTKVYLSMARNGQFDPDAGVTFNQLVAEAKSKSFIVEQTDVDGTRYLKLSV